MKLKYINEQRVTYSYIRTEIGKQAINLTLEPNDIIEVDEIIGKGLIGTGNFIEIKDIIVVEKPIKIKSKGKESHDNPKGIR